MLCFLAPKIYQTKEGSLSAVSRVALVKEQWTQETATKSEPLSLRTLFVACRGRGLESEHLGVRVQSVLISRELVSGESLGTGQVKTANFANSKKSPPRLLKIPTGTRGRAERFRSLTPVHTWRVKWLCGWPASRTPGPSGTAGTSPRQSLPSRYIPRWCHRTRNTTNSPWDTGIKHTRNQE